MLVSREKDLYIRVVEYAVAKDGPFDLNQMYEDLALDDNKKRMLTDQIDNRYLLATNCCGQIPRRLSCGACVEVWCSARDRFRLLEYQELHDARRSSKKANLFATVAIMISMVSFTASILFSLYEITSPIKLPASYLDNDDSLRVLLDRISENAHTNIAVLRKIYELTRLNQGTSKEIEQAVTRIGDLVFDQSIGLMQKPETLETRTTGSQSFR